MQVAISSIKIPEHQVRLNPGNLTETGGLAENIKKYGMLHPILVIEESTKSQVPSTEFKSQILSKEALSAKLDPNPNIQTKPDSDCNQDPQSLICSNLPAEALAKAGPQSTIVFTLIAGYRRLKAAESLGWTEVPVTIIPSNPEPTPATALAEYDLHLSENIKRKCLAPIELSEVILERKYRFEQVHGPIKNGGDRKSATAQEIRLAACQTDSADFYEQTSRLLETSIWTIYRLLRLQELEQDLKLKVYARELSYTNALTLQSERNLAKKNEKKPSQKSPMGSFVLPNRETAERYAVLYRQTPKLLQLFQLVYHSWQTIHRLNDYQAECDQFDLELLHNFIVQLGELLTFYNALFTNLQQSQDQQINKMINLNPPQ
jgi:hypothetical protein